MKKGIRQILCIMTVVISLLTTSALALSVDYAFITKSRTEYKRVSTADKGTYADVDIHVTDDVNGDMGVYFRVSSSRNGNEDDDFCTSSIYAQGCGEYTASYSPNTLGTKYLFAMAATASGAAAGVTMEGYWVP